MKPREFDLRVTTPLQECGRVRGFRSGDALELSDGKGLLLKVVWDDEKTLHLAFQRVDVLNME